MFQKLRRQMTLFCTLVTGAIFIAMTLLCLFLFESALRRSQHQAFLGDVNSVVSYLEGQTVISNQWLAKMEGGARLVLYLYDNGLPLLHNTRRGQEAPLAAAAYQAALEKGLDIAEPSQNAVLSRWVEFSLKDPAGQSFYGAAATFPKAGGTLSALILYPLERQERQIAWQRLLFASIDLAGLLLLGAFAWFFTGRMLRPLQESQEKQAQFISAASHELRSPLTVMLSNLAVLERAAPEEQGRFRENIRAEGNRMSRLIDDMLALANADSQSWSLRRQPTEPDTLALEMYERFWGPAREKGLELTLSLPEGAMAPCHCDPDRAAQALAVLLDNALSYTPAGGRVALEVRQRPDGRVEFVVTDTGPGVPDSEKERIFQRFYRADASRKDREHFGLGLCVAREIAQLHKGRLWVEDAPGGGAAFHMTI